MSRLGHLRPLHGTRSQHRCPKLLDLAGSEVTPRSREEGEVLPRPRQTLDGGAEALTGSLRILEGLIGLAVEGDGGGGHRPIAPVHSPYIASSPEPDPRPLVAPSSNTGGPVRKAGHPSPDRARDRRVSFRCARLEPAGERTG